MKKVLISTLISISCFAGLNNIQQFEADFTQTIVDEKNKTILYSGHIKASKPQYALWNYKKPITKDIYILDNRVIIVEPELEQAILKTIDDDFNFFNMIQNAKTSITYKDDFDNNITIKFTNTILNKKIPLQDFQPDIPRDYDFIQE